jgi:hypothetical protein
MQKFLYTLQRQDDLNRTWTKPVAVLLTNYPEVHAKRLKKNKDNSSFLYTKTEFPEDMSEACHATSGRQVELQELCEVEGSSLKAT